MNAAAVLRRRGVDGPPALWASALEGEVLRASASLPWAVLPLSGLLTGQGLRDAHSVAGALPSGEPGSRAGRPSPG